MPDSLSEIEACDLIARLFRARGYKLQRNIPFREYGVEFHIDGWDPVARIGFEFLSSEDEDHDDLSLEEYKALNTAQQRGELALFIIDEVEPLSVEDLKASVHEFLDEAAEASSARRSRKKTAKKKPVVRTAAKKSAAATPRPRGAAGGKKAAGKTKRAATVRGGVRRKKVARSKTGRTR